MPGRRHAAVGRCIRGRTRNSRSGLRLLSEDLFDGTHILVLRPDAVAGCLLYLGTDGGVIRELQLTDD